MTDFDPYHHWLGIPPHERPLTLYRILGLQDCEPNRTVIQNAADRQMTYLRQFAAGKHGKAATELLNETSRARILLLDPEKKAQYDRQLRRQEPRVAAAPPIPPSFAPGVSAKPGERPVVKPPPAPGGASAPGKAGEKTVLPPPPMPPQASRHSPIVPIAPPITSRSRASDSGEDEIFAEPAEDIENAGEATRRALRWARQNAIWVMAGVGLLGVTATVTIVVVILAIGQLAWFGTSRPGPITQENTLAAEYTNSIGMRLVRIPAGTFQMGSPPSEAGRRPNESPVHSVEITRPFQLATTEVTQAQWQAVMGTQPWLGKQYVREGPDYPATHVSWTDAVEFCERLSRREGYTYRLPTEAQWEYACRASTTTPYSFGDDPGELDDYAWYSENAFRLGEKYPHEVGAKLPNAWGLHDMHGNIWEWCQDRDGVYPSEPQTDPTGTTIGRDRIGRGGDWLNDAGRCRSAFRYAYSPTIKLSYLGFRVALVAAKRTQADE